MFLISITSIIDIDDFNYNYFINSYSDCIY